MNRLSKTILLTSTCLLGAVVAAENVQAAQFDQSNNEHQQIVEVVKNEAYEVHTNEVAVPEEEQTAVQEDAKLISGVVDEEAEEVENVKEIEQTKLQLLAKQENEQTLTLTFASDVQKDLEVSVWTQENEQTIRQYTATKNADGTYSVTIERAHFNEADTQYVLEVVGQQANVTWEAALVASTSEQAADEGAQTPKATDEEVENVDNVVQKDPNKPSVNPGTPSATVKIENINRQNGTFDVMISDIYAPKGLKELLVPVWSDVNGQNDLTWYSAVRQLNGQYKVAVSLAKHKYETGLYKAHVYMKQHDGSQTGVGGTSAVIDPYQTKGKMVVKQSSAGNGTMEIIVSDAYDWKGIDKILVPVWASASGQDDLVWYTASRHNDGTYRVAVTAAHHLNQAGEYNVHMYYKTRDGKDQFVTANKAGMTITQANRNKVSASVELVDLKDGKGNFEVVVKDVYAPNGIKSVLVPIWSEVNGQNDLVWYTAQRQTDGTYKVATSIAKHKYEIGTYNAHVYVTQNNNQQVFAKSTTGLVSVEKPKGDIAIENQDDVYGRFDVVVSGVKSGVGVKEVLVPVWADQGGQDDLVWYSAQKQADGRYKVSVDARKHRSQTGLYQVHLYYVQSDGSSVSLQGTSTFLGRRTSPEGGSLPFELPLTPIRKIQKYQSDAQVWKAVYSKQYGNHPTTYEELHDLPTAEKQKLAVAQNSYPAIFDSYTDEEIATIENLWDMNLVRSTFLNLVNAERSRLGLHHLTYSNKLNEKATMRATEQGDYGSSVYYKNVNTSAEKRMPHTRPDGSRWTTVLTPDESRRTNGSAEITLDQAGHLPLAYLLDEETIAKNHYAMWRGSKGHYDIITSRNMHYIGYDIAVDHYVKDKALSVLIGAAILSNSLID